MLDTILDVFQTALTLLYDLFEPITGAHSWGWATCHDRVDRGPSEQDLPPCPASM